MALGLHNTTFHVSPIVRDDMGSHMVAFGQEWQDARQKRLRVPQGFRVDDAKSAQYRNPVYHNAQVGGI